MDPIPSYNLLQAIDPTKIKLPISDRFAKLTLSSNKKKQQPTEQQLLWQQEKRDSVSRDISKQFGEKQQSEQNPLLRSESSKDTECNNSVSADEDESNMDPLQVSQDYDNTTQLGEAVELLSQQIASMAVQSKTISISSGSTCNLSEHSQLVSTESQRSSTSEANNIHIVRNIPINVKDALGQETIALNLTSSTKDKFEKTYEMTDDEDEDEEEEDAPITISDTSESHHEQEQDAMATSSLPSTSLTSENLKLPSLTADKAERVAAFLRDVSIERHVMVEQGHLDTVYHILDNKEIDKIQETLTKSRQIASADTDSMTPDAEEEVTPRSQLEREKRLKALEELSGNEQTTNANSLILTEVEVDTDPDYNNKVKNVHRLVNDETQDNTVMSEPDVEKTPKVLANLKTKLTHMSPKNSSNYENNVYRIANDETQCNTELSMTENANKTPKTHSNLKNKTPRKLANLETEDNIEFPLTEHNLCDNTDPRRLVNDETMANSIMTGIDDAQQSIVYNYTQDYKTPEKRGDARNNCSISIQSTPQSSANSFIINSSSTAPELSITISETDEESFEQKSPPKNENSDNKKLSNSFHREESSDSDSEYDGQMSQIQMSMAKINISAKINIKIHIPNTASTETSEDEQSYENNRKSLEPSQQQDKNTENNAEELVLDDEHNSESNDQSRDSNIAEKHCKQKHLKTPAAVEKLDNSPNQSSDSVEIVEDKKFLTEAEKLLNQLYGESWQTPDVIRTLKRSSQSGDKRSSNSKNFSQKKTEVKNSKESNSKQKSAVEESILQDFSIFTVSKTLCHPDALYYRDNYRSKKEDLSKILYDMYNEKLFKSELSVPINWNKKLSNTAGRCLNKKKLGIRSSVIELSDKVLTSADRLRCTLIHELCHAATWIFNGEGGHGSTWKEWARKANVTFPEIPKIGVCHQYDIEYKYTYKCTLCAAKSHAHSKSKKVENIRCSYCHGAIEVFLNKKDKDGNIMPTPVKEATGFAKFVKDNYKKFKRDDRKHADVMKLLSSEFSSIKVANT